MLTMSRDSAADWAVHRPEWLGLRMFARVPSVFKDGNTVESHLGHSISPRQRGFCFNVLTWLVVASL